MLDVGEDEFLVLLLVLQAQLDQAQGFGREFFACDRVVEALVDLGAIVEDLGERGPRQQAALRPWMHRAHALVVAVEQRVPFRARR
jgi:hypothetical protein